MNNDNTYYATGKRKSAIARTWLFPGKGKIIINNRSFDDYVTVGNSKINLKQPLALTNTLSSYDINVKVKGGGIAGQAGAIRHGITKALLLANPEFRSVLKRAGFITRDARVKERKKYGQKGARARFQFSKR